MKKLLFLCLLIFPLYLFAQDKKDATDQKQIPSTDKSNVERFLDKPGTFFKKEYFADAEIGNIKFEVVKITDIDEGTSIMGLYLSGISTTLNQCQCYLDKDELASFDKALGYMIDTVLKSNANVNQIEYNFTSRSNFKFSTYNFLGIWADKKKWAVSCDMDYLSPYTGFTFKLSDLPAVRLALDEAIETISGK